MYPREKTNRDEKYSRSRKPHRETTPSFSSTLLDEIYRSIDGVGGDKPEDFRAHREKPVKKQSGHRAPKPADGDPTRAFVRACLVDKWIEKSKSEKPGPNSDKFTGGDVMFFSSTSSSNSDSSGALSSSDTEFFGSGAEPKVSCFSTRPKPVKTGGPARKPAIDGGEDPKTAKSRALRMYANLKRVKQPISPGGRLTSFINSLFSNAGGPKKPKDGGGGGRDRFQSSASACSSASSYSRSCLSKNSPGSRERMRAGSTQRTVRFNPVSVVVDEKREPKADLKLKGYNRKINIDEKRESPADLKSKGYNRKFNDDFSVFRKSVVVEEEEDDGYDGMSDASSDLFELDHLAMFGNNTLKCEELPVYETTRLDNNRVIAGRLIR